MEETLELKNIMGALNEFENGEEIFNSIAVLMNLPDEEFSVIAPVIYDNLEKTFNNANDKFIIAQAVNASGIKAEELMEGIDQITTGIEGFEEYSQPKKDFIKHIITLVANTINETEGIAKRIIKIPIEKISENVRLPEYAHTSDSGMDVFALDDYTIAPGETKIIPTGIKVAIPLGYEIQVRPKSGRALKTKLRIANTPGTIDAGYREEIGVIVENVEAPIKKYVGCSEDGAPVFEYGSSYTIGKGEKFAQLVLCEVPKIAWTEVENVLEIGENRGGGYGSTGLK